MNSTLLSHTLRFVFLALLQVLVFKRLALGWDNFNYIKDSAGDLTTHQAFIQCGGKVLNGCDTTTVFALMAGAHGAIWGGANYMPKEAVQLYEFVKIENYSAALALWKKMIHSLVYIWHNDYIPAVKKASELRGFGGGTVRRPVRPLSPESENTLKLSLTYLDQ